MGWQLYFTCNEELVFHTMPPWHGLYTVGPPRLVFVPCALTVTHAALNSVDLCRVLIFCIFYSIFLLQIHIHKGFVVYVSNCG